MLRSVVEVYGLKCVVGVHGLRFDFCHRLNDLDYLVWVLMESPKASTIQKKKKPSPRNANRLGHIGYIIYLKDKYISCGLHQFSAALSLLVLIMHIIVP